MESEQLEFDIAAMFGDVVEEKFENRYTKSLGIKHDQGKPPMDLIPSFPLFCIAEVLNYGAVKYSEHNWRKGMPWTRPYAAAQRHLLAWNDGEDLDPETGLNHIDHALCELMFLRQFIKDFPDMDTRYK
jgi:hypothetical protein